MRKNIVSINSKVKEPKEEKMKNEKRSTIIQGLLDVIEIFRNDEAYGSDIILEEARDLVRRLNDREEKLAEADTLHRTHCYPDRALKFAKVAIADKCDVLNHLSTSASALIFFLLRAMSQDNLVLTTVPVLAQACNMSENTLRKALKELFTAGILTVYNKAERKGGVTAYMINPQITTIGKPATAEDLKKFRRSYIAMTGHAPAELIATETKREHGKKEKVCTHINGVCLERHNTLCPDHRYLRYTTITESVLDTGDSIAELLFGKEA